MAGKLDLLVNKVQAKKVAHASGCNLGDAQIKMLSNKVKDIVSTSCAAIVKSNKKNLRF